MMLPKLDSAAELRKIRRCFIAFLKEPHNCTTQRHGQRHQEKKESFGCLFRSAALDGDARSRKTRTRRTKSML